MGRYGWNKSKFGTVQDIVGDYIFHSYQSQPSDSRNTMAFLNLSKTLNFMRGAFGVKGVYSRMENSLLSQGLPTDYCNDSFSLTPFVNGNISAFLNWDFRFTWDKSWLAITNLPSRSADNFIYSGSLTVTPCSLITWATGGEYYRNQIEVGNYKEMLMLDTKLTFNVCKRVELSVSVTNLFDKKRSIAILRTVRYHNISVRANYVGASSWFPYTSKNDTSIYHIIYTHARVRSQRYHLIYKNMRESLLVSRKFCNFAVFFMKI